MLNPSDNPSEDLWNEYAEIFHTFDDLTLARWLCQTLGQLEGRVWRMSHPLMGAYRLAGSIAQKRGIWHQRLVDTPSAYTEATCCGAPLLVLFTPLIEKEGLVCHHCGETTVPIEDIPKPLQTQIRSWGKKYQLIHDVAHWDVEEQDQVDDYEDALEEAAKEAERSLVSAARNIIPRLLEFYPTVVWKDHDECLEVRPEDLALKK